jgi:hypothetical protein
LATGLIKKKLNKKTREIKKEIQIIAHSLEIK